MKNNVKHHTLRSKSRPWSYGNVAAIAIFAGIATYILTSAYAEQDQSHAALTQTGTTTASHPALPVWASILAVALPFVILLPISLLRKQREMREMLIHQSNLHGPAPVTHTQAPPTPQPIKKPAVALPPKPKSAPKPTPVAATVKPVSPVVQKRAPTPPTLHHKTEVIAPIHHEPVQIVAPTAVSPHTPHEPGGIPPNELGIGVSLKDMVIKSMREKASKNIPKS